jgi:NAD(P)-dependent dehydrogenase (short-subunit alcohol dehydrogenase family)
MGKKIILVTGASSGIGKETAMTLAKQGHTIIMHGRDFAKTQKVFEEIKDESGNENISMLTADLSLQAEVKKLAVEVNAKFDHLDVLINNAGGQFGFNREMTSEGHEKDFAINTLAPFLLTILLLPLLEKSDSARIVTVSSESYSQGGKPILDDIELENHYSYARAYGLSKLYCYWNMRQFAIELEKKGITNVTVNTCEPGSADTSLGRETMSSLIVKIVYTLWKPMMWSIEKAAATSIYLATSDEIEGITGEFYGNCKKKNIKAKWISIEGQKAIWDYCEGACREYMK